MKQAEKREKKAREDQALNRILLWFGGAVLVEVFVLILNRFYVNFDASGTGLAYAIGRFLYVFLGVCAGGVLGSAVWVWRQKKEKGKLTLPVTLLVLFAALFLCALIATVWKAVGVQFLYIMVPVVAVLALIYYLYQREFFLVALVGGAGLFALWIHRKLALLLPVTVYVTFALVGVVTVVMAALFLLAQRGKGTLPLRNKAGKARRLLPAKANYGVLYAACGVNVVSLLAALIFGRVVAYVFLFLLVAWLFAAAIYYTVKLM